MISAAMAQITRAAGVAGVVTNPTAKSFVIYLTGAVTVPLTIAWFAIG